MKLRIQGDSLRFRITRSELARLASAHSIEDTIHLGPGPDATLTYVVAVRGEQPPVQVAHTPQRITVTLSEPQLALWRDEQEVGIYISIDVGAAHPLKVILEKDFACLDRSEEDNRDTFDNPLATNACGPQRT